MSGAAITALKELDQTAYLACLFVPEQKREAFAAVHGYAAELKRITLLVSEPLPGEIRLQWWRDVVSGEQAGDGISHPVASALLAAIADCRLPVAALNAMSEARIFDLYHDPMQDIAALESYLGEIQAALIQLCCLVLDPLAAAKAAEAAGHAGMAIGIANILRRLVSTTVRRQIYIPADILSAIGCNASDIFNGDMGARRNAIAAIVALGRDHLKLFQQRGSSLPQTLRPAFLGVTLCEPVFRKAEKLGALAFETEITLPPLLTPVRLAYRAMRGW
jgi:15-cis-phytoene synthase